MFLQIQSVSIKKALCKQRCKEPSVLEAGLEPAQPLLAKGF